MDESLSSISTDEAQDQGSNTCTIFRKFESKYSDIPLKVGQTFTWTSGFRVYFGMTAFLPIAKGHSFDLALVLIDGASALAASAVLGTALALGL